MRVLYLNGLIQYYSAYSLTSRSLLKLEWRRFRGFRAIVILSFYLHYTWEYRKGFIQTCSERFTQFLVELPWQVPASFLVKLVELYSATFSGRILSRMFFRAFLKFFNKTVILQSTCEWSVLKITQNISFGKLHRKYCTNK